MKYQTVNPATEDVIAVYETMPRMEVRRILEGTHAAFRGWRDVDVDARAQRAGRLAPVLRERLSKYARLISIEMAMSTLFTAVG